jgi:hypothetical protein
MKKIIYILLAILFLISIFFYSCKDSGVIAPPEPLPVFIKTFGGSLSDRAVSVQQTFDGGLIIAGYTISAGGSGGNDGFALKLDNKGSLQWYRIFGGPNDDQINSVYPVTDGGFILVGESNSFSSTSTDIYVVKLDMGGNLIWSKLYRAAGSQYGTSVVQTADFGFLVSGYTDGSGSGNNDALVMKLDFDGAVLWMNTYGDAFNDYGSSIKAFDDNSSIMAGYTYSGGAGSGDIMLIRLDPNGIIDWTKYYGGDGLDQPFDLKITSDNGYIVSGITYSFGLITGDAYIFKTDINGFVYSNWSRTFGGPGLDQSFSIIQSSDGKYLSAGVTGSFGAGLEDVFLIKLFGDGEFEWAKTFGSSSNDAGASVVTRSDNGFSLAGYTQSYGAGNNDIYAITMKEDGLSCGTDNPITPIGGNPVTIVNPAAIFMLPVPNYEAIEAGTMINTITPAENTVCSQ